MADVTTARERLLLSFAGEYAISLDQVDNLLDALVGEVIEGCIEEILEWPFAIYDSKHGAWGISEPDVLAVLRNYKETLACESQWNFSITHGKPRTSTEASSSE